METFSAADAEDSSVSDSDCDALLLSEEVSDDAMASDVSDCEEAVCEEADEPVLLPEQAANEHIIKAAITIAVVFLMFFIIIPPFHNLTALQQLRAALFYQNSMIIMGLCFVLISIVYSINVNLLFPVYKYVSKNSPDFLKVRIPVLFSL